MLYVLTIFFLFSLALFFWISSKGIARKDSDLLVPLATLIECPTDTSFLLVQRLFRKEFIQFCKYRDERKRIGIMMVFPIRKWSEVYKDKLLEKINQHNLSFDIYHDIEGDVYQIMFGDDLAQAQLFSQEVLRNIFGFNENTFHRVHLEQ